MAPVTPVVGQLSGPTYDGRDTVGEFQAQMHADVADVAAAQAAGMAAEHGRRDHYATDILPTGSAYGDAMALPPVPDNALPPAASYGYPYAGMEPNGGGGLGLQRRPARLRTSPAGAISDVGGGRSAPSSLEGGAPSIPRAYFALVCQIRARTRAHRSWSARISSSRSRTISDALA